MIIWKDPTTRETELNIKATYQERAHQKDQEQRGKSVNGKSVKLKNKQDAESANTFTAKSKMIGLFNQIYILK